MAAPMLGVGAGASRVVASSMAHAVPCKDGPAMPWSCQKRAAVEAVELRLATVAFRMVLLVNKTGSPEDQPPAAMSVLTISGGLDSGLRLDGYL